MMKGILKTLFTHVILIIFTVIALFPFVWIITNSFKTRVQVFAIPPVWIFEPTFTNYADLLLEGDFPSHILNSCIITLTSVSLALFLGVPAAYIFDRYRIKSKESMYFFIFTIRMGPAIAFAIPLYLICNTLGILDTHIALVLIYQTFNLPFVIWMMRGFFQEVPSEIDEAALIDGCSRMKAFFYVVLPLVKTGIFASAILSVIFSWNEFFLASVITRSVARTIPVDMPAFIGLTRIHWEKMCAAGSIAAIPVLFFALIVRKQLIRGLTLGSIKG